VLIEDTGHGTALIQELRGSGLLHAIGIRPDKDKVTRMSAQSAKIEAKQLLLPSKACVYRKPKPGRGGDEVRQGLRVS
jgi:phage terminase large subunit-like protein